MRKILKFIILKRRKYILGSVGFTRRLFRVSPESNQRSLSHVTCNSTNLLTYHWSQRPEIIQENLVPTFFFFNHLDYIIKSPWVPNISW